MRTQVYAPGSFTWPTGSPTGAPVSSVYLIVDLFGSGGCGGGATGNPSAGGGGSGGQ
jgi:hypothetical protein